MVMPDKPGERVYHETSLEAYKQRMRNIHSRTNRKYSVSLFTAVSAGSVGDVRYLLCIERRSDGDTEG